MRKGRLFNINDAGSINAQDLGRCLRALGFCPVEHELQEAIAKFDADGNDGLSFGEFVQLWCNISADSAWQDCVIERAFQYFDMDQTGAMPLSMLKSILTDIGEPLTVTEVDSLLRVMDSSNDGIFYIQDFMKACSSKSRTFARGKLLALEPCADTDRE
ncbi:hypothetical protein BSKO_00948 [Bryopsis sp. KO-2023]|nr:hypothetical protein BSKO_00948 [Bryopsis sp. KO-2023]